jgi:hypothetical protein
MELLQRLRPSLQDAQPDKDQFPERDLQWRPHFERMQIRP